MHPSAKFLLKEMHPSAEGCISAEGNASSISHYLFYTHSLPQTLSPALENTQGFSWQECDVLSTMTDNPQGHIGKPSSTRQATKRSASSPDVSMVESESALSPPHRKISKGACCLFSPGQLAASRLLDLRNSCGSHHP